MDRERNFSSGAVYTAVFKNCRLGRFSAPVTLCLQKDGSRILEILLERPDEGLQFLLSETGRIQGLPEEVFSSPGCLRLLPADPQCREQNFAPARLARNTFYRDLPGKGRCLSAAFSLEPESGKRANHSAAV